MQLINYDIFVPVQLYLARLGIILNLFVALKLLSLDFSQFLLQRRCRFIDRHLESSSLEPGLHSTMGSKAEGDAALDFFKENIARHRRSNR